MEKYRSKKHKKNHGKQQQRLEWDFFVSREPHFKDAAFKNSGKLNTGHSSDFVLVSSDTHRFKCHKDILSNGCPYFKAMLQSEMQECSKSEIRLENIDKEVMEIIRRFIYTGEAMYYKHNVVGVIYAADMLMLNDLLDACVNFFIQFVTENNWREALDIGKQLNCKSLIKTCLKFFENHIDDTNVYEGARLSKEYKHDSLSTACYRFYGNKITEENCFEMLASAKESKCEDLIQCVLSFIDRHMLKLSLQDGFCSLTKDELIKIITDYQFNACSDECICNLLLKWAVTDENQEVLNELILESVQLDYLSPNYIKTKLLQHPLIIKNPDFKKFLESILGYVEFNTPLPENMPEFIQRWFMRKRQCLFVLGYYDRILHNSDRSNAHNLHGKASILFYQDEERPSLLHFETTHSFTGIPFDTISICSIGFNLFVSGIRDQENCLWQYSTKDMKWSCSFHFKLKRVFHNLIDGSYGRFYAAGGCINHYKTIPEEHRDACYKTEESDSDEDHWETDESDSDESLDSNEDRITELSKIEFVAEIEELDSSKDKSSVIGNLLVPVHKADCFLHKNKLYVFSGLKDESQIPCQDIQYFDTELKEGCILNIQLPLAGISDAIRVTYHRGKVIVVSQQAVFVINMNILEEKCSDHINLSVQNQRHFPDGIKLKLNKCVSHFGNHYKVVVMGEYLIIFGTGIKIKEYDSDEENDWYYNKEFKEEKKGVVICSVLLEDLLSDNSTLCWDDRRIALYGYCDSGRLYTEHGCIVFYNLPGRRYNVKCCEASLRAKVKR